MAEPFVFKVNLGGMIDILANHLYSSPDVFVRELLQNGADAISARKLAQPDFRRPRMTITIGSGRHMIFTDNGIGLTEPEIHQFLAVIGQSSKRDKETGKDNDNYIGRFGIGMLSCFMVTDEIMLRTRSARDPEHAYEFHGKPDGTYSIQEIPADTVDVGTAMYLNAKPGSESYFDEERITDLVLYYGLALPYPVILLTENGEHPINVRMHSQNDTDADIMALGRKVFRSEFLGYIPLESKSGLFSGTAYILPHAVSLHAKTQHRIYLKNMLLTEDGEAILPKWSGFLRCILNTTGLRPTASRENFYEDENLERARQELSECISGYLLGLSRTDPRLLEEVIQVHFMAIKSLACEDETFFRTFIPFLKFETNMGELSGKELLSRRDAITFANDINQYHRTSAIMLAQGQLLVNASYVFDTALLRMLQEYEPGLVICPLELVTMDEFLREPEEDTRQQTAALLRTAEENLREYDCDVQLKRFTPEQLPVFFMLDDNAETLREIRHSKENSHEMFASMLDSFAEELDDHRAVLFLNWNNPLIRRLAVLDDPEKVSVCLQILYVQALLTGRFPMRGGEMAVLNDNLIRLIEWGIQ